MAVLLAGAAGCGGPTPTTTAPAAHPSSHGTDPTSAEPSPPASMSGIVVVDCQAGGASILLTAYDPVTGRPGSTLGFTTGSAATAVCPYSSTETPHVPSIRNRFSRDYQKLAAVMTTSDGGKHIGYLAAGGGFVDLSPVKGTGYGTTEADQSNPVFNPTTGRLWYYDAASKSHLGSVDAAAGATSQREETPAGFRQGFFANGFDFAADSTTLINYEGVYTPDGKHVLQNGNFLYDQTLDPWRLRAWNADTSGTAAAMELAAGAPAPGCSATSFIDADRFLCVGDGTQNSAYGLYVLTISVDRKHLVEVAVLPASKNAVLAELAGPDGEQIAFISGGTLYLANARGPSEPRVVAKLPDTGGNVTRYERLAGWDR